PKKRIPRHRVRHKLPANQRSRQNRRRNKKSPTPLKKSIRLHALFNKRTALSATRDQKRNVRSDIILERLSHLELNAPDRHPPRNVHNPVNRSDTMKQDRLIGTPQKVPYTTTRRPPTPTPRTLIEENILRHLENLVAVVENHGAA